MRVNIILIIGLFISSIISSCGNPAKFEPNTKDSTAIQIGDTVVNKYDADAILFETARDLNLAMDSVIVLKDSVSILKLQLAKSLRTRDSIIILNINLKERLGVSDYKLLRIREYNRIAGQRNNIKYLRGWINRVINK